VPPLHLAGRRRTVLVWVPGPPGPSNDWGATPAGLESGSGRPTLRGATRTAGTSGETAWWLCDGFCLVAFARLAG
jgi:hypothetical protein